MRYKYKPLGVCSNEIEFETENGIVKKVFFTGGCSGSSKGIAALVEGMPVEIVIERLKDIECGMRGTSCPQQLALALIKIKENGEE